jgi:hypothetical protein
MCDSRKSAVGVTKLKHQKCDLGSCGDTFIHEMGHSLNAKHVSTANPGIMQASLNIFEDHTRYIHEDSKTRICTYMRNEFVAGNCSNVSDRHRAPRSTPGMSQPNTMRSGPPVNVNPPILRGILTPRPPSTPVYAQTFAPSPPQSPRYPVAFIPSTPHHGYPPRTQRPMTYRRPPPCCGSGKNRWPFVPQHDRRQQSQPRVAPFAFVHQFLKPVHRLFRPVHNLFFNWSAR